MPVWKSLFAGLLAALLAAPQLAANGSEAKSTAVQVQTRSDTTVFRLNALPFDLSFLNHRPAGKYGPVRADGADLVFEDGTAARFWGVNIQAYALFGTDRHNTRRHARRLAKLGVNIARLHHHDSAWVRPNVFGDAASSTRRLDKEALARIDWWIKCLRDEGIYVWLDLHVGRQLTATDDVRYIEEIIGENTSGDLRGFNFVNDDIKQRMQEFTAEYLSHVNAFTGLSYAEDPAVAAVLITNENDLTHHFGNALLPDKAVPNHSDIYLALAKDFADANGLSRREIWRSWEFGPSKLLLADLEQRFFSEMIEEIRDLGFKGLIATTNLWGGMSLAGLPSLTLGDVIDVHSYGEPGETSFDPRQTADMFSRIAAAQVADMPLSVSEWNITPFPAPDRFIAPLRLAAMSAFQGWDALMFYGYAQQSLNEPVRPENWGAADDPAFLAMFPAAALAYRQAHVAPAKSHHVMRPDPETLFGRKLTADTLASVRTLAEQTGLWVELPETPELPWLQLRRLTFEATGIADLEKARIGNESWSIRSDTNEMIRDFGSGTFSVDTDRSQIIAGQIGNRTVTLSNLSATLESPLAAIAVQSLDGSPLRSSGAILISLAAPSEPLVENRLPYVTQSISGSITFEAPADLSILHPGDPSPIRGITHSVAGTSHTIRFNGLPGASWISLARETKN